MAHIDGVEANKKMDEWVSEICRCMTSKGMSFGAAVDYLMSQKRAAGKLVEEDEIINIEEEEKPRFTENQIVQCPTCKTKMKYSEWAEHWKRYHGR